MTDKYLTHAEAAKAKAEGKDVQSRICGALPGAWEVFQWSHLYSEEYQFRLAPPAHPWRSEMTDNNVPLLSACLTADDALEIRSRLVMCETLVPARLIDIADGRAVVIPRRTEKEWRAEFEKWVKASKWHQTPVDLMALDAWLAALRHVGAIRPDEKEGV